MLTVPEKVLFTLFALATTVIVYQQADRIWRTIRRGQGDIKLDDLPRRVWETTFKTLTFEKVFRFRLGPSFFHGLVAWAFLFYLIVNIGDGLEGFFAGLVFLGKGTIGDIYRLVADLLSAAALIGITALLFRRFTLRPQGLSTRETTLLHPKARVGIRRDSLIVGGFILLHVGFRLLGESFDLAEVGPDPWRPVATAVSGLWGGVSPAAVMVMQHVSWWIALGLILAFFPYFLYSKHLHIFFAPINYFLQPERQHGALEKLTFEDESLTQFGALRLEDLPWKALVDSYACIMCYRCQEVCPAYHTGKVLSPAAMEINKRYFLNQEGARLARGEASSQTLLEFAITPEAVWACTACGACNDICPVGDEPMRDILDIRRGLVLMENQFPEQLQNAFRGMERAANPWNVAAEQRLAWAQGLDVPTVERNPDFEILWWVGCAPATDARAQKTTQALAKVLKQAGVNYAVLGTQEMCTGDSARRAGNEYLFNELAKANVETLNGVLDGKPRRILTTCPHCLHTLLNEYGAFGGQYELVHHTQFINELAAAGRLRFKTSEVSQTSEVSPSLTFHDPCYLGRHNSIVDAPRQALAAAGARTTEMPRHGLQSFCCGAGGAQMWKEEEAGRERVSANRIREAQATGAGTLAVGCPFCMIMLTDGAKATAPDLQVRDVAEVVAENLLDSRVGTRGGT